jgi:alpha-amylase/alpha-mannosidase (GH57 family)
MKTARICLVWHMHQPYYTDPVSGTASMPWVRLHATKAYFDMAHALERFPAVRSTFNFTPSLLTQLNELVSGSVVDLFLEYTTRPAVDLTASDRAFLLRHFFAANWANMVRPFPRYHELLVKRGLDLDGRDLDRLAREFSAQDFLDLQVWHNLAWFGYGAVARYPALAALRLKDRGFTEEDKRELLAIQLQVVGEVIPLYRKMADLGQIELTTSPFYHPILPLVIDTDIARRPRRESAVPSRFQAPEDAQAQLRQALALHTTLFGRPPQGLWPSEGSVCPEMIPLLCEIGLKWMATDEGILANSIGSWNRRSDLYQAWSAAHGGREVAMIFRDRELSDVIGFVYSKWAPEPAADDFLGRVAATVDQAPQEQVLVPVILDGENPWEHYYDGGEQFLGRLYAKLSKAALNTGERTVYAETVSRSLEQQPPQRRLTRLYSGSWINADFKIWIGHPEDNRGWELLQDTRKRLLDMESSLSVEEARGAWQELYAAEGSDWFWWYGDDFHTEYKLEFDLLFRTHLRNVFIRAGKPVPESLNHSVMDASRLATVQPVRLPVRLINPTIDGVVTSFFEWRGAGSIDPAPPLGAMWKSSDLFGQIAFGFNLEALFVRLDLQKPAVYSGFCVEIHIASGAIRHKAVFPLVLDVLERVTLWTATADGYQQKGQYDSIAFRKIMELAIPFKDLDFDAGQEVKFSIAVTQEGLEIERYPRHHPVTFRVPDRNFEAEMWRV